MKRIIILIVIACISSALTAQEKIKTETFTKILVTSNLKVKLKQAEDCAVQFEDTELKGKVAVEVKAGQLSFTIEKYTGDFPISVWVFAPKIEQIEAGGNAIVRSEGDSAFVTDAMLIQLTGVSKAKLNLQSSSVVANANGAAKIDLSGTSARLQAEASGAANIDATYMNTEKAVAVASGAANVKVHVSREIIARASGASTISYTGNPSERLFDQTGVGKISHKGDDSSEVNLNEGVRVIKKKVEINKEGNEVEQDENEEHVVIKKKKRDRGMRDEYGGLEFGLNTLTTPSMAMKQGDPRNDFLNTELTKSWFFHFNFGDWDYQLGQSRFALASGVGLGWNWLEFSSRDYVLKAGSPVMTYDTSVVKLSENEMSVFSVSMPFMLKWSSSKDKYRNRWHAAVGAIFSYSTQPKITTENQAKGYEEETEKHDDYHVNRFRVMATARAGYSWFNMIANVGLTPFFDTSVAPDTRMMELGLAINFD